MGRIFNRKEQAVFRRRLRREMTRQEQLLWERLKAGQLGVKFRRQHGIGPYVADFYCPSCKLVLEIDGDSHFIDNAAVAYDQQRSCYLSGLGIRVLRFSNLEVMTNLDGVLIVVLSAISSMSGNTPTQPPPG